MILIVLLSLTTTSTSISLQESIFNSDSQESWNIFIPMLSEKNIEVNMQGENNYEILKNERRPIIFNEPILWDMFLEEGNKTYSIIYETPEIRLNVQTNTIDNNSWIQNISLITTYDEPYKDINIKIATPKANKINITPNFDYDRISDNNINIYIPKLLKKETIILKGEFVDEVNNSLNLTLNLFEVDILFETSMRNVYSGKDENWPIILKIDKGFEELVLDIKHEELVLENFLSNYQEFNFDSGNRLDLFSENNLRPALFLTNIKHLISLSGKNETDFIYQKQKEINEKKKLIEELHKEGFKAEIRFQDFPIKSIEFKDIVIKNSTIDLGVEEVDLKDKGYIQSYAIDPEKVDFTEAEVIVKAKGHYLMKCDGWDFENEVCGEVIRVCGTELDKKGNLICEVTGGWKKVMKITPGEDYSFILTPKDPCFAEYNTTFTAPYCANGSSPCVAGSSLLMSVDSDGGNGGITPEPNQPNTIDGCSDGSSGSYQEDENVENITITSLNNSQFRPGDTVRVDAYVYCYSAGASDNINFVYANNASLASPSWTVKNYTDPCPAGGFQKISTVFNLDDVIGDHVVRVINQYSGDTTDTCGSGGYDDNDDVVFNVVNKPVAPTIYVQRGASNVVDTSSSITTELELTMNYSNSFILFTASTSDNTPDDWQYTPDMSDDGNYINFTRYSTNGATEVKWEIVQADYLDVQRGQEELLTGSDSVNVPINEVDLSESFVIVYGRCADETDSDSNAGFFAGNFTNSTNVKLWRGNEGDCDSIVSWQVVHWDSSYVESGVATIADSTWNTTVSLSNTIANISQTMLFFSSASIGTDQGMDSNLIMGNITDIDELFFNHEPGTTYANAQRDITWFVVEVPGSSVQKGHQNIKSDESATINAVNLSLSFHHSSGWNSGGGQSYSNWIYNSEINETTNIFLDPTTGSNNHWVIWETMEIPLKAKTAYNCTYTKFSGDTTDFNKQPSPVVSFGTLEIPPYGKIVWNNDINITNQNFDLNVNITSNKIWLNTDGLKSEINSSANITLYNLDWQYPILFNGDSYCSNCNLISYSSGTGVFSVPHFSTYTSRENANLTIWDTTDSILKSINEQVDFYANYTNSTNNNPLNGVNIGCTFSQNSSGSWSVPTSMTFNSGSELYEYNMSFPVNDTYEFNITCENTVNYANFSARDTFPIASSVPEINLISPVNGYNSTSGLITTFEYNVSDAIGTIQYCELIINGQLVETNSSVVEDIPQSFSKQGLLSGINKWGVNCSNGGTEAFSETWEINVSSAIFEDTFGIAGGFTPDSVNTAPWQRGTVSQTVVTECYDDTNCWGTNLVADYTAGGPYDDYLVQTNQMDLRYYENITLFFYHFRQFEDATTLWDTAVVDINNSGSWSRLTSNEGYQGTRNEASTSSLEGDAVYGYHGTNWELQTFDLSSHNVSDAQIRFHFAADESSGDEGWFIDRVRIDGDYKIDTIKPTVNLDFPGISYYDDNNRFVNMTFNATVTDNRDIVNCSFYTNLTGSWEVNQTDVYSSQGGVIAEFNLTNLDLVSFDWNIKCYDAEGYSDWANANRTATFNFTDRTPPEIYLNLPSDGSSFNTYGNILFNVSANDTSGLLNCTLWINKSGVWGKNETKTFSGTSDSKVWELSDFETGNYEWNAYCCDTANHCEWNNTNFTFSTTRYHYPIIENLSLNSSTYTNYTLENLTAHYDVSDEDVGDSSKLEGVIDWKLNGDSISILNLPFTRSSNNTYTKEYAYGLEGVGTNTVFHDVDFKYGMGIYNFSNANSVLTIDDDPINKFELGDNVTMMAWVKYHTVPSSAFAVIIEKGYESSFLFGIGALNGGNMMMALDTGTGENDCNSGFNIADGNWHHIAATYDHNRIKTYVDGIPRNSCAETASLNLVADPWSIGSEYRPSENPYWQSDAEISGVWVLRKALSIDQIKGYMNGNYSKILSNETLIGDEWQSCITPNDGTIDGSMECSNNITILDWLDEIPPNVSLMTLLDNYEETNTKTPSFFFNATDEYATNLSCWLNITDYATLKSQNYASNNSVELDTPTNLTADFNIPNGLNYWNIICSDGQNDKQSITRTINISVPDYAPPNISLMIPLDGATLTSSFNPVFYFNVTDQVASVVTCDLIINDTSSEFYAGKKNVPTDQEVNITVNVSINDGDYDWRVYCDDGSFTAYSDNRSFTIAYSDSVEPTITLLSPQNNSIEYAGVNELHNFTVVDNDNRTTSELNCTAHYNIISGSSGNYGSLNNVNQNEVLSISGTQIVTAETEWYINCTDNAGNEGQSEKWYFNYYNTIWLDDMEPGHDAFDGNWIESTTSGLETFGLQDNDVYGGDYHYADSPDSEYSAAASEIHLTSPVMDLRSYHDANITFYHQYNIHDDAGNCNDAMIIEISTDGSSYSAITPEIGSYSTISSASNPRNGEDGFCGNVAWTQERIDLGLYAGESTVYLRWTLATNTGTGRPGYDLDNIILYGDEDAVDPVVLLIEPAIDYINDSSEKVNVTFVCNATDDYHLRNMSLFITDKNDENFKLNQSIIFNGELSNETNWTIELPNGNYTWNCLAYDFADNSDWADANRTVIINWSAIPTVSLVSPSDNFVNDTDEYVNLSFSATVIDDHGLINCSLWHNISGTWSRNQTIGVSGKSDTANFDLENLNQEIFHWNIGCYDDSHKLGFATTNRTVYINWTNSLPEVVLSSPIDNFVNDTDEYVNLSFSATITDDNGLFNCSLWHNISGSWVRNQTVSVSGKSDTANFNLTDLNQEVFHWNVECYDVDDAMDFAVANYTVYINWTNSVPTHTNPILNSTFGTNYSEENLTCYPQNVVDLDGHSVKNITNWQLNGQPLTILNMPFEGGSNGTETRDYALGNNGTVSGATWNSTGGYDGLGAYDFSSGDEIIVTDDDFLANGNTQMTWIWWAKMDGLTTVDWAFDKWGAEDSYRVGFAEASNRLRFYVSSNGTTSDNAMFNNGAILDDKWHQYTFTFDNGSLIAYVDGEPYGTDTLTHKFIFNSNEDLIIGSSFGNGSLDDMSIFNRSLSAEQIKATYSNRTDLIVSQETNEWDQWQCSVVLNDGINDGLKKYSNLLDISSYPDLIISNIIFESGNYIEGEDKTIYVNVTNNESSDTNNFAVKLNISFWNGTKYFNETQYSSYLSLNGGNSQLVEFNWTIKIGTYIFEAEVDAYDNISESNENNNVQVENKTVSAWEIFYGNYSYNLKLGSYNNDTYMNWTPTTPRGNLYYYDYDSSFYPFNLRPLNQSGDIAQADSALGLIGFNDSLIKLFDRNNNGDADDFMTIEISGSDVENIPIINSTFGSDFITGILYDSADGVGYDGSQDLVFISIINASTSGKYGTYDYEIKVPAKLDELKAGFDLVHRLDELK